jgi:hypothetical protein|tara:strand:+ start:1103 stop:1348 length:246 start_codon:yes stop_codon:yes gene_type:complete
MTRLEEQEAESARYAAEFPDVSFTMDDHRRNRDAMLKESDWVAGEDVPQAIKDVWFPYRQALRDITNLTAENFEWPTKPGE